MCSFTGCMFVLTIDFLIKCDLGWQHYNMVAPVKYGIVGPLSAQICMFHIPLLIGRLYLLVIFEVSCMVYFYRKISEVRSMNIPFGLPNPMWL